MSWIIKSNKNEEGIILRGWSEVELAVRAFANGKSGLRVKPSVNSNALADCFLKVARADLKTRDSYYESFGHSGEGPFYGTTMQIFVLDRHKELYQLRIMSAGVGHKPEIGLAKYLKEPLGLRSQQIQISFKPEDEHNLSLDFRSLVRSLAKISWMPRYSAKDIVDHYLSFDQHHEVEHFQLFADEELMVTLELDPRLKPFCFSEFASGTARLWFTDNNNCLLAQLPYYYHSEPFNEKAMPYFVIRVFKPEDGRSDQQMIVYEPALVARINQTAAELLTALVPAL